MVQRLAMFVLLAAASASRMVETHLEFPRPEEPVAEPWWRKLHQRWRKFKGKKSQKGETCTCGEMHWKEQDCCDSELICARKTGTCEPALLSECFGHFECEASSENYGREMACSRSKADDVGREHVWGHKDRVCCVQGISSKGIREKSPAEILRHYSVDEIELSSLHCCSMNPVSLTLVNGTVLHYCATYEEAYRPPRKTS